MPVRFVKECPPIVPSGKVHGQSFKPGETSDDAYVMEVAMRNGWAVDDAAPVPKAVPAVKPADADTDAASSAADPKPVRRSRGAAPENKAAS